MMIEWIAVCFNTCMRHSFLSSSSFYFFSFLRWVGRPLLVSVTACSLPQNPTPEPVERITTALDALPPHGTVFYVDPVRGDDRNSGTGDGTGGGDPDGGPWATLRHALSATSAFSPNPGGSNTTPGDTLYLRGGTYWETNVVMDWRKGGTAAQPLQISNYPGEVPILNGSIEEFNTVPNDLWVRTRPDGSPIPEADVYRSANPYPSDPAQLETRGNFTGGYFESGGKHYRLIHYLRYEDLAADTQYFSTNSGYYAGPGTFWDPEDGSIYIRLTPPNPSVTGPIPPLPHSPDPRLTPLAIAHNCGGCRHLQLEGTRNVRVHGLTFFAGGQNAVRTAGQVDNITLQHLDIRSGAHGVLIGRGQTTVQDVRVRCDMPPWLAWSDNKERGKITTMELDGVVVTGRGSNFTVRRNRVSDCSDSYRIASNQVIHDVEFTDNVAVGGRDDGLLLSMNTHNINVARNRIVGGTQVLAAAGAGTEPEERGSVYIHHNFMQIEPFFFSRATGPGALPEFKVRPAVSNHNLAAGHEHPWKIYNNTFVIDLGNVGEIQNGNGFNIRRQGNNLFESGEAHEVLNNIFVVKGDHHILSGSVVGNGEEIHDGNLYWRDVEGTPTEPLMRSLYQDRIPVPFPGISRPIGQSPPPPALQTLARYWSNVDVDRDSGSGFWCPTTSYYAPGWDRSSIEADPRLTTDYAIAFDGPAAFGAIDLRGKGWPSAGQTYYRGAAPPPANQIVGHWDFNTAGLPDESRLGSRMTLIGGAATARGGIALDGVTGYAEVEPSATLKRMGAQSFAISMRFRGSGAGFALLGREGGQDHEQIRIVQPAGSSGALEAAVGAARYFKAGFFPSDGNWHTLDVVVTRRHQFDYATAFYMDGVLAADERDLVNRDKDLVPSNAPIRIGTASSFGSPSETLFFRGRIDDVQFYDYARDPDAHVVGRWNFTNLFGEPAFDNSGQKNHGELRGASVALIGYSGSRLAFPRGTAAGLKIDPEGELREILGDSFTLSLWYRETTAPIRGWILRTGIGPGRLEIYTSGSTVYVFVGTRTFVFRDAWPALDQQWHLLSLVVERQGPTEYDASLYFDGSSAGTPTEQGSHNLASTLVRPLVFHSARTPYSIDELRVLNYARHPTPMDNGFVAPPCP